MPVQKEISRLPKSAVRMNITLPASDFRAAYEKSVDDIGRKVQIAGFRKGKAPRAVLERKFGAALHEDVLNTVIGDTVKTILDDETFPKTDRPLPYSDPEIDGDFPVFDLEKDLSFAIKWDAAPQVEVKEWTGLKAEVASVTVEPEDIGRELETIRDRNSVVLDRPVGEPARNGDIITVDYAELDENGKPIAGSRRENFTWTLGTKANIYEFDDEIAGMKTGEEKHINKTFPADFRDPDIAGKTKTLWMKVTQVKEKNLPDLDDELAQDVDEKFETLLDLKQSIRKRLETQLETRLRERKVSAILEQMMLKNPVEVPESMVQVQVESRLRQFVRMYGLSGDAAENFLRASASNKELIDKWKIEEERRLHAALLEEKLAEQLKIEVTGDDRDAELTEQANIEAGGSATPEEIAELKQYYSEASRRESLDDYLKTKKLEDLLLKENTVKAGAKQTLREFIGDMQ